MTRQADLGEARWPRSGADLWYGRTAQIPAEALRDRFLPVLSAYERNRYASYTVNADRDVYLLGHAMLRAALSHYFGKQPQEWQFEPEDVGKPHIAAPLAPPVEFSLSHTRGLAVCCFAGSDAVGVDVESTARGEELQEIVARQFAETERRMLASCPEPLRLERSVWLWTAKEALLKAQGHGLSVPLDRVHFDWNSEGQLSLKEQKEGNQAWRFIRFRIAGEFLGTIALGGPSNLVRVFRIGDDTLHPHRMNAEKSPEGCLELRG